MNPHQYWRALLRVHPQNGRAALKEFQLRTVAGGASACTGGAILSSGSAGGQPVANAFDGNTTTEWASGPPVLGHAYIGYDFGAPVTIVEAMFITSGNEHDCSSGGVLQFSDDGVTWVPASPGIPSLTALGASYTLVGVTDTGSSTVTGGLLGLAPGWPTQALNAQVRGEVFRIDIEDGGAYRIAGITRKESSPDVFVVYPYRRVRLLERQTGRLIRETWSDPVTGAYAFEKLKLREYILLTDDHARYYNAVAADAIVPVL